MPLPATCPRCGLSMDVADLSTGLPPCPACGGPLEEVPDAELAPTDQPAGAPPSGEVPPAAPPLSGGWPKVRRGLRWMQVGLRLFFAGWGLVVMAAVSALVLRLGDPVEADGLLVILGLSGSALAFLATSLFAVARLFCRASGEPSQGATLAALSAGATLLAAVAWLVPPLVLLPWPPTDEWQRLALGWVGWLVCAGVGEGTFLLFVRAVGRSLGDRATQEHVRSYFDGLALYLGLVIAAVVAVLALGPEQLLPQDGVPPSPVIGLSVLGAGMLLGLGSVPLLVRYLQAVGAALEAIDRRLPPPPDTAPSPAAVDGGAPPPGATNGS